MRFYKILNDTGCCTLVIFLACQKIKLLLRCPLEFPILAINSGFNNRILLGSPALIVALQTLR